MKNIKWTNEMLKNEALKYNTRLDFQNSSSNSAYQIAKRRGILDDICKHMITQFKWTTETLKEEASKYNSRSIFYKTNQSAYSTAYSRGILDNICSHMNRLGDIYNRFIYTIEFENNSVYVGLTCDLERRKNEHINISTNKYIRECMDNNISFTFNSDNILYSSLEAIERETNLIDEYTKKGYNVLNISKAGGLGGGKIKWTYDTLKIEALKYTSRNEFKKGSSSAYKISRDKNILDDICSHMLFKQISWTIETIKEEALKYSTRKSLKIGNPGVYYVSQKRGILDDVCSHMTKLRK